MSGGGLVVEATADPALSDLLADRLEAFNERHWPGHLPWVPLAISLRDGGELAAGLAGETYAGMLFVRYLWVGAPARGRGVGRAILTEAERVAVARGCGLAWLNTFSFQAPGFYERLGYARFGAVAAAPEIDFLFFQKRLAGETLARSA